MLVATIPYEFPNGQVMLVSIDIESGESPPINMLKSQTVKIGKEPVTQMKVKVIPGAVITAPVILARPNEPAS